GAACRSLPRPPGPSTSSSSTSKRSRRARPSTSTPAETTRNADSTRINASPAVSEARLASMGEKIAKTGIKRDNTRMYFVRDGHVWAKLREPPGVSVAEPEIVASGIEMDTAAYLYYVDEDGDVARVARGAKATPDEGEKVAKLGLARDPNLMYY